MGTEAATAQAERIGPTAHYTAYVWRRLGLPYADALATRTGALLYWGAFALGEWTTRVLPGVPTMRGYLAYRHLLIDAMLERLAPDRLIELGAGLTQRTIAWAIDRDVDTVDVDLPGMIAVKREALARLPEGARARLGVRHRMVAADVLAPGFAAELAALIGDARRPVVVAEGLVSYFDAEGRVRLLAAVAEALAQRRGGALLVDLHTADAQARFGGATRVLRSAIRVITRRRHALAPFADEAALRDAIAGAGFDGMEIVDARDHVAREPRLAGLDSPAHVVHAWVER